MPDSNLTVIRISAGIVSDKIPEAYQQEFRRLGIKMRLTR